MNTIQPDTAILPCPFCGSTDISDGEVLTGYPNGRTVTQSQCNHCMALGAEATLEDGEIDYGDVKAIAAWNRRTAQPEKYLVDALEAAHCFIQNGIEMGYISMPDADTPDPAHETPDIVADALAKARESVRQTAIQEPFGWAQQGVGMGWHAPTDAQIKAGAIPLYRHPASEQVRQIQEPVADQTELDARRYRWLRGEGCNFVWAEIGAGNCLAGLDKAIDAAMREPQS